MDQVVRNKLRNVVTQCRKLLEESIAQQLQGQPGAAPVPFAMVVKHVAPPDRADGRWIDLPHALVLQVNDSRDWGVGDLVAGGRPDRAAQVFFRVVEKQPFIDATLPAYDQFKDVIGAELVELAKKANEE